MKSTELRLGNHYTEKGIVRTIVPVDILNLYRCEKANRISDMKPTPLTEGWLLKFGWTEEDLERGKILLVESGGFIIRNLSSSIVLKHVHQLQNLHFALTGEELTLKSES
jgi:hypothetical protein